MHLCIYNTQLIDERIRFISHKKRSRHNLLSQNTCRPFFTLYFMVCWLKFGGIPDRRTSFEKFTRNVVSGSGPTPSMMTHLTNQTLALVRWSLSGALSRLQTLWCHVKSCHDKSSFSDRVTQALHFSLCFFQWSICSFLLSAWLCILVSCWTGCQNVHLFMFLCLVHRKVRTCFEGKQCFQVTLLLLNLSLCCSWSLMIRVVPFVNTACLIFTFSEHKISFVCLFFPGQISDI